MAEPVKRPREGEEDDPLLLVPPRIEQPSLLLAHRSHSSHRSHRSHSSHSSGGYRGGGSYGGDDSPPAVAAPAPPPKPARVTLVAYPGGRISVDGKLVGTDSTGVLVLQPGRHDVRIENRFVGDTEQQIDVAAGQTGIVLVKW